MAGLEESTGRPAAEGLAQAAPAAISGPWTQALLGDSDEEADAAMLDAIAPRPAVADLGTDLVLLVRGALHMGGYSYLAHNRPSQGRAECVIYTCLQQNNLSQVF